MIWILMVVVAVFLVCLFMPRRKKEPSPPPVVTFMSHDDFVDFALDLMREKDSRGKRK